MNQHELEDLVRVMMGEQLETLLDAIQKLEDELEQCKADWDRLKSKLRQHWHDTSGAQY